MGLSRARDMRSGNDIKEQCEFVFRDTKTNLEDTMATYCLGFMRAILFTGEYLEAQYRFYTPVGVTINQGVSVFLKYVNANPEYTHLSAEAVAVTAFRKAWPCQ